MRHAERHALHHSKDFQLLTTGSVLPRHITNGFVWEVQCTLGYCSGFLFPVFSGYTSEQLCKRCAESGAKQECHTTTYSKNDKGSRHTLGTGVWRGKIPGTWLGNSLNKW